MAAAVVADDDAGDEIVSPKSKKAKKYSGPSGPGVGEMLTKVGGIPTILFALGTFLVIWFTFMTPIGEAAIGPHGRGRRQAHARTENRAQ